jgi:hypothetical protein
MNRLRGRRDARRAVDVDPDVVVVGDKRLTRMKAHADAQRRAARTPLGAAVGDPSRRPHTGRRGRAGAGSSPRCR